MCWHSVSVSPIVSLVIANGAVSCRRHTRTSQDAMRFEAIQGSFLSRTERPVQPHDQQRGQQGDAAAMDLVEPLTQEFRVGRQVATQRARVQRVEAVPQPRSQFHGFIAEVAAARSGASAWSSHIAA